MRTFLRADATFFSLVAAAGLTHVLTRRPHAHPDSRGPHCRARSLQRQLQWEVQCSRACEADACLPHWRSRRGRTQRNLQRGETRWLRPDALVQNDSSCGWQGRRSVDACYSVPATITPRSRATSEDSMDTVDVCTGRFR